jgi:hypothetical protein
VVYGRGFVEIAAGAEVGYQKTIKDLMAVSKSLPPQPERMRA